MKHAALLIAASALMLAGCNLVQTNAPELELAAQQSTSNLYSFDDALPVPGSWSKLTRNDAGMTMRINTSGLEPGEAFTIWWVIFNYPDACEHPVPGLAQCGEGDLLVFGGNPAIASSVLHATGHVIGRSARGNFGAHLSVGDTSDALFGPGLLEARGAEVHLVVRSHGPAISGLVSEQIGTFGGGCNDAPADGSLGTPGPNTCYEPQFAIHTP